MYKMYSPNKATSSFQFPRSFSAHLAGYIVLRKREGEPAKVIYKGDSEAAALAAILKDLHIEIERVKLDDTIIVQLLEAGV